MKLTYKYPPSIVAFNFNLRRYTTVVPISSDKGLCGGINTTVVKYTKVAAGVAEGTDTSLTVIGDKARGQLSKTFSDSIKNVILDTSKVGRCRLTVSKPVLKAPMVSALETRIS